MAEDYTTIEQPYNNLLQRSDTESANGNLETQPVKSDGAMADVWIKNFMRSENWKPKSVGFYIDGQTGYAEFSNVYVTGGITVSKIDLPDSVTTSSFHVDTSGNTWWGSTVLATAVASITNAGVGTFSNITITGGSIATSTLSGTIPQANLNIADRGWSQTCVFSVTDADTISWGSGIFTSADGTVYNIVAGNTGNMAAKTYIYLDIGISSTTYQVTTTSATSVGVGKVLLAVAQNGTTEATYEVMFGQGGKNIDAANIVAGSITANEIAATTITSGKMNVTSLSSINANLGTITAGTITGVLFRTAATGQRIEMDTTNTNQIRFYNSSTLYGQLEVSSSGGEGIISLASTYGGGLYINTGVGASGYASAEISANGGSFGTSGNASNSYAITTAVGGGGTGEIVVHGGGAGSDITVTANTIDLNGAVYVNGHTLSGTNTGDQSLSGYATYSGSGTFSGGNYFTAGNTFSGSNLFSASNTFSSSNTFSGVNTFSDSGTGNYFNWIRTTGPSPTLGGASSRFYLYGSTVRYTTLTNDSDIAIKKNI